MNLFAQNIVGRLSFISCTATTAAILENDFMINVDESKPTLKKISVRKDTLFFYSSLSVENEIYGLIKVFGCR